LKTGAYRLPGTLTIPKLSKSFQIVVFVHGSGPHDRDESIGPNKPFRDLAHGLANHGIASLRFDKRTFIYGANSTAGVRNIDLNSEILDDATTAVQYCAEIDSVEGIYVLGHSLGGMMAPKIASENEIVNGIILMAANSRPLEEVILDQYQYLFSADGITNQEQQAINELIIQMANLQKFKTNPLDTTLGLPLGLSHTYWRSLNEYDQLEEIHSLTQRILVIQGARDYQVSMKDFELWKKELQSNPRATFKLYSHLNHFFQEGEGLSFPEEYLERKNIPDYVINDIASWILQK